MAPTRNEAPGPCTGLPEASRYYQHAPRVYAPSPEGTTPPPEYVLAVKGAARGHWDQLLAHLAPTVAWGAGPCPRKGCQGTFGPCADAAVTGAGVCDECGTMPDGIAVLMYANCWPFAQALAAVAEAVGLGRKKRV